MPVMQTRATLDDLGKRGLGPKFEEVFEQNLIKFAGMDILTKIVDIRNTDKAVLRTTGLTGYPTPTEFDEGDPVPEVTNIKTFETQYNIRDNGSGVTVTDDCLDDRERLGSKLDEMANLAASVDIGVAKSGFQVLNGAFGTTAKVNGTTLHRYNGEAMVTTSHARADGGTAQSNKSATDITLTELNLETGRLALVKQLTDIGLPIVEMGRIHLVVPDDLQKNATIFVGSDLRPSTANNDLNFYKGIGMDVISSRWLDATFGGSATQWFLIATLPGVGNAMRIYRKGGPRFNLSQKEGRTWNVVASVKNRYAAGNSEFKGIWGSDGVA